MGARAATREYDDKQRSESILANVRWSSIVTSVVVWFFAVFILFFPMALPFRDAIAGGLFIIGIALAVAEIAAARQKRKHAKEKLENANRLESILKNDMQILNNWRGQNPTVPPGPPFTTRSLLEMCWGMTMNLSHEEQQQSLGKILTDDFMQIFAAKQQTPDPDFLQNLKMALSSAIRNIGFVRACHVQYFDFTTDQLTRRRQSIEHIADFASFSGSGLFAKLGSFVGVGSIFELISRMNLPQLYVPIFVVGGITGAFLVTVIVNIYVRLTDDSWVEKITRKQSDYWVTKFKPDVTEELFHLYTAIKWLVAKFYPGYKDELLQTGDDDLVKNFINNYILPPDDLEWPPYTVTLAGETSATGKPAAAETPATSKPAAAKTPAAGKPKST